MTIAPYLYNLTGLCHSFILRNICIAFTKLIRSYIDNIYVSNKATN